MTTSTSTQAYSRPFVATGAFVLAMTIGVAGLLALIAIAVASLAVAFPIVLSLVDRDRIILSAGDLATSRELAGLGWAFATFGLLHLAAAAGALADSRWMQRLAIAVTGVGAGIGAAATVSLLQSGGRDAADGALMVGTATVVYLFAFSVSLLRRMARA